jgi:flagellar biosynthesis/type III secretory pathway M-ring protein FliF/YscJ
VVTWIVVGVVLFAFVVLALAVRSVLARLPRLRRAALALQRRQADAEALRAAAEVLQERAEALQQGAAVAQERTALIKAKRAN